MDNHFSNMRSLTQILDQELFELMQANGDYTHFYFCYRWFLLDFKRGRKKIESINRLIQLVFQNYFMMTCFVFGNAFGQLSMLHPVVLSFLLLWLLLNTIEISSLKTTWTLRISSNFSTVTIFLLQKLIINYN